MLKVALVSGSIRADSFNQTLLANLSGILEELGAKPQPLNLKDFDMPLYNGDYEAKNGLPEATSSLKSELLSADAVVFACPEYNGFMTPVLLNAIDWCTRSPDASVDLSCFSQKPIFVAAASPGPGGGARAAGHLKTLFSGIGAYVSPASLTIPSAFSAYDAEGKLLDEAMVKRATKTMAGFLEFAGKLAG